MIDKFFKLNERQTSIKIEVLAGITMFLSVSYILFVNPSILSETGMDQSAVFVATAIAAAVGTLIMGLYANYPVVQAPGMGMNAFFTYTIVLSLGYSWNNALLAVFISGLIFILLALTGVREMVINAIPSSLKYAVSAGVGFFIAFIGLKNAGIVVANPATFISLGDFSDPNTFLAILGTIIVLILIAMNVKLAIFIGMFVTAIIGVMMGLVDMPSSIFAPIPSLEPVLFKLFDGASLDLLLSSEFIFIVLSVLFLDFFDTAGTLMGVATRAGLVDDNGNLRDSDKALLSDATATTIGALVGTSSVTSYVESVVGVEAGARTGLSASIAAICFLFSLFFSPLLIVVTAAVTAPALISVGALMASSTKHIDFDDFADTAAAFFTMIFMILAFSIAEGIAIGFLTYVILKVASKQGHKVHPIMYFLAFIFLMYFINK